MRRRGRDEDQDFDPQEVLYHRVTAATLHLMENGGVYLSVRVPDVSCNRSKHGGLWDDVLLCNYPANVNAGVVEFAVSDVPSRHDRDNADPIHFRTCHDPLEDNYYHCEIRFFRGAANAQRMTKNVPDPTKTWFRAD